MIAVPIILNIIEDTRKSSVERSREIYLKAVEVAIMNRNLMGEFNPNKCEVVENGNLLCDVGQLEVEVKGNVPKVGGTITIKEHRVIFDTLDFGSGPKLIGKAATEGNKTLAGKIPQGNFDKGDEYIVNVDGEHEYHFYVLSTEGDKVNLIMSNNICSDGSLAIDTNTCLLSWISKENYNDDTNYGDNGSNNKGPVTAMGYLHEATKNWNNIENIQMNYTDEGNTGEYGYGGIVTANEETKIISSDGAVIGIYKDLKARLPKLSEMEGTGCNWDAGSCPVWMVNGLKPYYSQYPKGVKDDIENIYGYWSLSSTDFLFNGSRIIYYVGYSHNSPVSSKEYLGIRPVIEVLKSDLS